MECEQIKERVLRGFNAATAVGNGFSGAGLVPGGEGLINALLRPAVLPQERYHKIVGSALAFHGVDEIEQGLIFARHTRRQYISSRCR
jgi:hypothetical protein